MKLHIPITYRERETQDSAVHLLCRVLDNRYLDSLENEENSNIREAYLRRFLKEKQGYTDSEADQDIAAAQQAAGAARRQVRSPEPLPAPAAMRKTSPTSTSKK